MLKKHFREISVALALLVLLIVLAFVAPSFFQAQPTPLAFNSGARRFVVACGMALIIICRQIDISVGSQFAICSVCAGLLASMKWPIAVVLPAVGDDRAIMGAINGGSLRVLDCPPLWSRWPRWSLAKSARLVAPGRFVNLPETCNGSA